MTVKFLHKVPDTAGDYHIPVKAKEIKVPICDVYFPGKDTDFNRETYFTCAVRSILQESGQTINIYTPEVTSMDLIRAAITAEL